MDCKPGKSLNNLYLFKITVHVGTVQNFEIGIFAENKYTLNELLAEKICFSIRLIVCET